MFRPLRQLQAVVLLLCIACPSLAAEPVPRKSEPGPVIDTRAYIEHAVELIEGGDYALARTYLEPALIDYRLSAGERSRAYYLRGYSFYVQGFYVSASKDYTSALEFNPDNPAALAAIAGLHARGLGVSRDEELAYQLFSKAAHAGHVDAQFHVGYAELEGRGTEKNLESARRWLQGAAEQGHVPAMEYLARSYRRESTDHPDPEQAKIWYERAYAAGAIDALVALAFMYQNGEFGEPDPKHAVELFTQAAEAGSSAGQVSLGYLYMTGESLPRDYGKALELFKQAAAQGVPASFLGLGHLYEAGLGVKSDLQSAEHWYRLGAEAGLLPAQLRLAGLLLRKDDPQRQAEAMSWLARATEQDSPEADNDYAWLLATHKLSELRDGNLAVQLALRAVAKSPSAAYLDTLAAAYAEAGEFADAIATQERALALLDETQQALRDELNAHLQAYQQGKPWRE